MVKPRALVLRTAGTNCDEETRYALELAGAKAERVHVNHLAVESDPFGDCRLFVIPGGFTYGDDVAAGRVLAVELMHVLGDRMAAFVDAGGLVLGICNGFQVLVKTGLLPDARHMGAEERSATLTTNDSHRFECRWVHLKAAENTVCLFAEKDEELELPVAHAEGKLVIRTHKTLQSLHDNGQIVYRYAEPGTSNPGYPADPNGSVDHIAGLCDRSGRVFGLMPHPERHIFGYQHPRWTRDGAAKEGAGLRLFRRAVQFAAES